MEFEDRVLVAMKKTLLAVVKDTTTKPELKHPLSIDTQGLITQCLGLIASIQHNKVKDNKDYKKMKPFYSGENISQSVDINNISNIIDK
ncbi:hypothetical protein MNB_SUP05-5-606 [hydrothermal vent metagenome]|uniref:Segregation and condensation protein A n=1 Tax=hydrothermal vent metagenome TaxID=652676 RepID=A0A1W1CK61_9ZZZZ